MATITGRPTAEPTENRPPTVIGISKVLSSRIPRSRARSGAAVIASTWSIARSPKPVASQARAPSSAVSVSIVVNDFEQATTRVDVGSRPRRASSRSSGSTPGENRMARSGCARCRRASTASAGPRWLPPIPSWTRAVIRCPVAPIAVPARMAVASSTIWSKVAKAASTSGLDGFRSRIRRAPWMAARSSEPFTVSPCSTLVRVSETRRWRARSCRCPRTSSVRC